MIDNNFMTIGLLAYNLITLILKLNWYNEKNQHLLAMFTAKVIESSK